MISIVVSIVNTGIRVLNFASRTIVGQNVSPSQDGNAMTWSSSSLSCGAWIWIHVSRSSRKGEAPRCRSQEEIFSDQVARHHVLAYMVRPILRVEREREEQKRARQAAIDRLRAGFPRPAAFGTHRWRETVHRPSGAGALMSPPDFDRVLADARLGAACQDRAALRIT